MGFFGLHMPGHTPEGNQDRTLGAGTGTEAMEACCLAACFPWLAELTFLYAQGLPAQGWHFPQ